MVCPFWAQITEALHVSSCFWHICHGHKVMCRPVCWRIRDLESPRWPQLRQCWASQQPGNAQTCRQAQARWAEWTRQSPASSGLINACGCLLQTIIMGQWSLGHLPFPVLLVPTLVHISVSQDGQCVIYTLISILNAKVSKIFNRENIWN